MSNPFANWTPADVEQHNARARKLPVAFPAEGCARESVLHEQIFDECRRRGWIALHGAMSERTHRTPGEFDFVILADKGRVLLVECKTKTGKLSPEQQAMKFHAEHLGHAPAVVRSMEEFLRLVNLATDETRIL